MRLITKSLLTAAIGFAPVAAFAADSSISNVTVSQSNGDLGATNALSITFTTTGVADTSHLTMGVFNSVGDDLDTSMDFSAATTDYGDLIPYSDSGNRSIVSDFEPYPGFIVDGMYTELTSSIPAGTYTLTFEGIVNPSSETTYHFGITTSNDQSDLTAYTLSDAFDVKTEIDPSTISLTGLKVKNITKREALLKWSALSEELAGDHVFTYTVQVFKKNGDKIKTFKNIANTQKQLTKASNLLKAGKTYKFRVRACATEGEMTQCIGWSSYKSFTTKS